MDGIGERINGISVVERLGTEGLEENLGGVKGRAIINVGIRLDNPDELLDGVVEVELDLVGRRSDRLVTSELNLLNEVLMGVLGHLAALISVEENVVNIERSGDKRLLVGSGGCLGLGSGSKGVDSPETLTKRTNIKVDLDLVILKGDQRERKSRVTVEPELKRNVEGGLWKGIARSAHLGRRTSGSTRSRDTGKVRISNVGKLGGVTNELEVTTFLLLRDGKLVPDVHPVTILTVNALTSNLDLNLGNELLTDEIKPSGIDSLGRIHGLVDLGESHLKVGAVSKITISGDSAGNTATEIGLARESLLNRLQGKVSMASVGHLPESNLGSSGKENVLCAVSD
jgi:hypothetical protein